VAKFVANHEMLGLLRELGIDYAQSYFLAPPTVLNADDPDTPEVRASSAV